MKIWVYCEHHQGEMTEISLQCLEKGRQLAHTLGGALEGVAVGNQLDAARYRASQGGISALYLARSQGLDAFVSSRYLSILQRLVEEHRPHIMLFPASTQGNDLAPALAGALRCGAVTDCVDVAVEGSTLICRRLEYDRKVLTNYVPLALSPAIVSLVDGVCEVPDPISPAGDVRVFHAEYPHEPDAEQIRVVSSTIAARTVNLRRARIIVAGGAGAGNREGFELINELARALGAEVGATRAAVDAGWASHDRQIGQTGVAVRPDLYIACGISGAVQHRVGILGGTVVAINTDPSAPIFRMAHYAVVGDLRVVIPRLITSLGKKGTAF